MGSFSPEPTLPTLGLRLLASRTVRAEILAVLSPSVHGDLLQLPQETDAKQKRMGESQE